MKFENKDYVGFNDGLSLKENLHFVISCWYKESMLDGITDSDRIDLFIDDFLQSEYEGTLKKLKKKVKKSGGIGAVAEYSK
jgi:hypothetical protein